MRTRPIQMNFSNGEIAPRLFGRSDLAKYWASLEELQNFVILPYGGVTRRDGLHYVADQGIETRKVRLLPFIFSTEQAYIVEAGHEYMRFFMNHGQIQSTPSANTVLLLHMNGLDGSNVFTDDSASAHVVTAQGTAQIDTDYQKFGSGSGLFASAGSAYLSIPDHADFNFSADDIFTFETNIRISSLATTNIIFSHETDADNLIMLGTGSTGRVNFSVAHTGVWQVLSTDVGTISVDTWYHVRIAFETGAGGYEGLSEDTFKIWINGTEYGAYDFSVQAGVFTVLYLKTYIVDSGYTYYIDGLDFSWRDGYSEGDNLNPYGLLSDLENDGYVFDTNYETGIGVLGDFDEHIKYLHLVDISQKDIPYFVDNRNYLLDILKLEEIPLI